eukprot:m.198012 g.198012  ORF g.198012 m.198012 type:complete len:768 (-) comp17035_c0_seq1:2262-4565(-)
MGKYIKAIQILDVQRRRAPSKHYVYVVDVTWSDGSVVSVYRRYSQFFDFHTSLLDEFPEEAGENGERCIPYLPGKKLIGRSHTHKVAQSRVKPIDEYLKVLIELPEHISRCNIVMEFFEAQALDIQPPSQEERERKPEGMLKKMLGKDAEQEPAREIQVGDVMVLSQYRAVSGYTKQDRKELSFKEGDIFEVVEKNDNGWWFVSNDVDTQGWVPATYLEPLDDPDTEEKHSQAVPGANEKYITSASYKATNSDEIGFEKGVVVRVLEKKLDGWWRVEYQNKQGWAPGTYLQRLQQDEQLRVSPTPTNAEAAKPKAAKAKAAGKAKAAPAKPKPPTQLQVDTKTHPPRRESIQRVNSIHGDKGPFGAMARAKAAAKAGQVAPAKPKPPASGAKPSVSGGGNVAAMAAAMASGTSKATSKPKPASTKSKALAADEYITREACRKEDDSGIALPADAVVKVLEKSDTGWWFVAYQGQEGWAPSDYLIKPDKNDKAKPAKPAMPSLPNAGNKPKLKPTKPSQPDRSKSVAPVSTNGVAAMAAAMANRSTTMAKGNKAKPAKPSLPSGGKPKATSAKTKPAKPAAPKAVTKPSLPGKPKPAAAHPKHVKTAATPGSAAPKQAVVSESFTADNADSVSVKKGETVTVEEESDTGWWFVVKADGTEGWAPSDYLKLKTAPPKPPRSSMDKAKATALKPTTSAVKPKLTKPSKPLGPDQYHVVENYTAASDTEVTLTIRTVVTVLEQAGDWWFAKTSDGAEGWAPANFLSKKPAP